MYERTENKVKKSYICGIAVALTDPKRELGNRKRSVDIEMIPF